MPLHFQREVRWHVCLVFWIPVSCTRLGPLETTNWATAPWRRDFLNCLLSNYNLGRCYLASNKSCRISNSSTALIPRQAETWLSLVIYSHPRLEYSRSVFQKQFSVFLSGSFRSGLWQEESEAKFYFWELIVRYFFEGCRFVGLRIIQTIL